MTHVTKILGCPGSGKSHTSREEIVEALGNRAEPSGICILSFTRAAVTDIREGVEEAVEGEEGLPLYFADDVTVETYNALCLRVAREDGFEYDELIALDKKVDEEYFKQFFRDELPQFSFATPTPEEYQFSTDGAKMIAAYNLMRARGCVEISDFVEDSRKMDIGCTRNEFRAFVRLWEEWKHETGYRQHADYIAYIRERELIPQQKGGENYRVLVIDEFQDLSPIQYAVYKLWRDSNEFNRIIIAGDAAQSVYGFRGANPAYLVRTSADETIELSASRRCAPEVIRYADRLIAGEGYFSKELSSICDDGDSGFVEKNYRIRSLTGFSQLVSDCVENGRSTFVLARRNKDVKRLAKALNHQGIPHTSVSPAAAEKYEGLWYWDEPLPDLLLLFRHWGRGELLSPLWVESFLKHTTIENDWTYRVRVGLGKMLEEDEDAPNLDDRGLCPPEVMQVVTDDLNVGEAIETLNLSESRVGALKNALSVQAMNSPSNVRIGTIHSSKGLEADSVIIFGDVSDTRAEVLNQRGEELREEKRVYFVGVTRARKTVHILSGVFGSERSPALP